MNFRHLNTILHKELRGYFNSPLAYIFITVFLSVSGWMYFRSFFLAETASMRAYFSIIPWIFLLLIPAITMRLWAEEKKMGTLETLLTAPVTEWEAVLGKFFASLAFLLIVLLLTLILPVILFFIGSPDFGMIVGGYLGSILIGATYLAVGLWMSSLTDNQIIAFIFSTLIIFLLYVIGQPFILQTSPSFLVPFMKYIGLGDHFNSLLRGVIDSRDIIYYLSMITFFIYLNVASLNRRRWN